MSPDKVFFYTCSLKCVILKFSQGSSHSASLPSSPPSMLKVPMAQESLSFTYLGGARAGDVVKNREKLSLEDAVVCSSCLSVYPSSGSFLSLHIISFFISHLSFHLLSLFTQKLTRQCSMLDFSLDVVIKMQHWL